MPHQIALTVVAEVRPEAADDLRALLATMGDGVANDSVLDFGSLSGLHFARLVLVEESTDLEGDRLPASLDLPERPRHLEGPPPGRAGGGRRRRDRPHLRQLRRISADTRNRESSGSPTCAGTSSTSRHGTSTRSGAALARSATRRS